MTQDLTPLAPRARLLFYLQAFSRLVFFWVPACVIGGVVLAFFVRPLGAAVLAVAVLFAQTIAALWWPSLAFDRWGWAVRGEDLVVSSGVVLRRLTAIPLSRVQHVDVRQGPLEQWFGLGRVVVHTASGLGADGVIPGLELDDAEKLRDRLVATARGDDGV